MSAQNSSLTCYASQGQGTGGAPAIPFEEASVVVT